jgi:hypothetical protein
MDTRRLISVVASAGIAYLAWDSLGVQVDLDLKPMLGAFASVSATLLGFLLAALAILRAAEGRTLVANMRKTGHSDTLLNEMFFAAVSCFIVLLTSLAGFFVAGKALIYVYAFVAGSATFMFVELWASGRKFYQVMINLD